jgi:hypothetical protein
MRTLRVVLPFKGKRKGKKGFDPSDRMRISDKAVFPFGYKVDLDTLDFRKKTVEVIVEITGEPLLRSADGVERWLSDIPKREAQNPKVELVRVGSRDTPEVLDKLEAAIRKKVKGKAVENGTTPEPKKE